MNDKFFFHKKKIMQKFEYFAELYFVFQKKEKKITKMIRYKF